MTIFMARQGAIASRRSSLLAPSSFPLFRHFAGDNINKSGALANCLFDLSANADTICNGTAAQNPTWTAAGLNGHQTLHFDGSDVFADGFWTLGPTMTVFAVARKDAGGTNPQRIIDGGVLTVGYLDDDTFRAVARNQAGTLFTATVDGTCTAWHVLVAVRRAGQVELYVDGVASGPVATTGTDYSATNVGIAVGATTSSTDFFKGDWEESGVIGAALTAPEVAGLTDYLAARNAL